MKEALLYEKLEGGRVRCNVCRHRCAIGPGKRGYCQTRLNSGGTLYTLIYGRVSSLNADPVEKKPLFHFYPGSRCLSLGAVGCNFRCPGCQNWEISRARAEESGAGTDEIKPEELISLAAEYKCQGIAWTYNEPSIWLEYVLDGAKLAKAKGLYTACVTNGFMTPEWLEVMGPYLDAFRVDIKGFSEETYQKISGVRALAGVLDSARLAQQKHGMHVECVTNVTPGINDDDNELLALAKWIVSELGPDTPWHVTGFYPHLDLSGLPPTPLAKLERVRQAGLDVGLRYVYLGNVPAHPSENTYCHKCGELLIRREGFSITGLHLKNAACPRCKTPLPCLMQPAPCLPRP
ncbi:MAG TPA: AmmeMemoRadiSam system radical SAM enzyme [Elusimicrobia bacterium]|nr:AmmeMemoRadiSam system radical SAM enzyme [Elusimicrobiota bacterium]